ncbi:MAG: hypothetical protein ACRDYC_08630, partial [Acidimicrobiales bacterium]
MRRSRPSSTIRTLWRKLFESAGPPAALRPPASHSFGAGADEDESGGGFPIRETVMVMTRRKKIYEGKAKI